MTFQLSERRSADLANLSMRTGRSADDLLAEAVDRLIADEAWFGSQVQLAIDQIARGDFLEEEEMDARVARMMRS